MPSRRRRRRAAARDENSSTHDDAHALVIEEGAAIVPHDLIESAKRYAAAARAASTTKRAYEPDWRRFRAWCEDHCAVSLPASPRTVGLYATHLAEGGWSVSTIRRAMTSIAQAHRLAQHESPIAHPHVQLVLAGIRRTLGMAQRQARPLLVEDLRRMMSKLPADRWGLQARALLLLGHAGAFRRSEVVAIDVEDLAFVEQGLLVTVRRSKTDQEGRGAQVAIPFGEHEETCPVRAVRAWLDAAKLTDGPLFRVVRRTGRVEARRLSDRAVCRLVKRMANEIGLDPALYSAHSLRAGLATSAARAGKSERSIMRQGRWRTRAMVDRYVRDATLFDDNAAERIGL